jgi:hypothetical protein
MSLGMSRFPDPYQAREDVSHAAVFLVVLLLLIVVGAVLFFGSAWIFAPSDVTARVLASPTAHNATNSRPTPAAPPTFSAPTPVPPLAGVLIQPTPTPTTPATATAHPPTATVTVPAAPTATAKPTPPAGTAHVGNTGGDGAYLRHTPRLADHWVAWPDNTSLVLLGNDADGDGQHWLQVRDPRNDVGWMPAQFVVP